MAFLETHLQKNRINIDASSRLYYSRQMSLVVATTGASLEKLLIEKETKRSARRRTKRCASYAWVRCRLDNCISVAEDDTSKVHFLLHFTCSLTYKTV
jgi:hypothetical protein